MAVARRLGEPVIETAAAGAGNLERAASDIRALSETLRETTTEYRL